MTGVMQRNIRTVLGRREAEDRKQPLQLRVADAITRFTGSMKFVYIHLGLFAGWIVVNLPFVPLSKFDPTYVVLAMFGISRGHLPFNLCAHLAESHGRTGGQTRRS